MSELKFFAHPRKELFQVSWWEGTVREGRREGGVNYDEYLLHWSWLFQWNCFRLSCLVRGFWMELISVVFGERLQKNRKLPGACSSKVRPFIRILGTHTVSRLQYGTCSTVVVRWYYGWYYRRSTYIFIYIYVVCSAHSPSILLHLFIIQV